MRVLTAAMVAGCVLLGGCSDNDDDETRDRSSRGRWGGGKGPEQGMPRERLSDRKIQEILTKDLTMRVRPVDGILRKARRFYDDYPQRPEAMYMAVKHFQIYLASWGETVFPDMQDQALYLDAKVKLVKSVTALYRRAWEEMENEDWNAALRDFELVHRMIPVKDEAYPEKDNELFLNVREWIRFIRGKMATTRPRRF